MSSTMSNSPALDLIQANQDKISSLCEQRQVSRLELFGSATSVDVPGHSLHCFDPQTSDLDFLVEFAVQSPQGAAERFFGLRDGLANALGHAIDLVELHTIQNPYFLEAIAHTRVVIYDHSAI